MNGVVLNRDLLSLVFGQLGNESRGVLTRVCKLWREVVLNRVPKWHPAVFREGIMMFKGESFPSFFIVCCSSFLFNKPSNRAIWRFTHFSQRINVGTSRGQKTRIDDVWCKSQFCLSAWTF